MKNQTLLQKILHPTIDTTPKETSNAEANSVNELFAQTSMFLRLLISNVRLAILIEDEEQNIVFINDAFCQTFMLPNDAATLTGKKTEDINVYIKDGIKNQKDYEGLNSTESYKVKVIELQDGRTLEADLIIIQFNNKIIGKVYAYRNITDTTLANKKLETQKILFETILTNLPVDVAVFNPEHSDLFLNPVALKDKELRKWMIDWMIGKDNNSTLQEVDNSGNRYFFNEVLNSKKLVTWEEEKKNAKGEIESYLRNMYPVVDVMDNVIMVIGYNVNITHRKNVEQQIKISEKRYRDLINYSSALICTHDLEGNLMTINPTVSNLLECPIEEVVGRNLVEFLSIKSIEKLQDNYFIPILKNGTSSGVFTVISKTGKRANLLFQNYMVKEEGTDPYVVLVAQNITERITAEKELIIAKKISEDAAHAKEVFLANMSHEIRTPMNGIMGVANLLSKTELDVKQKNFLKLITDSANNLLVIVNDVLDIEKIASGQFELEKIPFKIIDKISNAIQSFQYKTEEKGLQLVFINKLPENIVAIGDPYRLIQILNNLLTNAIKFTDKGKISLETSIDINKNNSSAIINFKVIDTGIGIEADRLNAVFKPYIQAASSTSRKYGGTGLGLTICKDLIEMQGGKIEVTSIVEKGTTFHFSIPYEIGNENSIQEEVLEYINYIGLEGKTVLVADDVELNQFLANSILENWGCIVTLVDNGEEALEKVKRNNYDIILMDIHMPEMDGITASKLIRKLIDPQKASIPIVALTANALKGNDEIYYEAGMEYYISKPFTENNLYNTICSALKIPLKKSNTQEAKPIPLNKIPTAVEEEKLFNLTMLESMGKGKPEFVKKMISIFVNSLPADISKLMECTQKQDWLAVSKTAHRMKPSIDGMGIESLKETIRQIETLSKEQEEIEIIKNLVDQVVQVLNTVLIQLKNLLNTY